MQKSTKSFLGNYFKFRSTLRSLTQQQKTIGTEKPAAPTLEVTKSGVKRSKLKMGGWQIHSYGELEELQYSENLRIPQIRSANQCLVKVQATTVNPIDVAMLKGYGAKVLNTLRCQATAIEFPLTLGREFCGELVQRGMGVSSKLSLGDRVWGVVPVHAVGAHAEYVAVPDCCLSRAPATLSNEDAAAVLYAGLTAWSGLYITAQLGGICGAATSSGGGSGQRVLVLGGSGAVGSLAVQLLKSQGVQVVATCSEDAVGMVQSLGPDLVIDYKNPVEMQTLRSFAPFDIVLDCAGQGAQAAETINVPFRQYVTFSSPLLRNIDNSGLGLGLLKNVADLVDTNVKSLSKQGGFVKWGFFVAAPQGIEFLKKLVERRKLLPNIDSHYDFKNLPQAFQRVQDGHLRGKVVVNLSKNL